MQIRGNQADKAHRTPAGGLALILTTLAAALCLAPGAAAGASM